MLRAPNQVHSFILCVFTILDKFVIYQDGIRRPETYYQATGYNVERMANKDLSFALLETTKPWYIGNCDVDEVHIFEMELSEEEVKELYEYR